MSDTRISFPPSSEALRLAYERLDSVIREIRIKGGHKLADMSLGEYLRRIGDDYVFLSENPGP